jgi:phage protein U
MAISGDGLYLGLWCIESIGEDRSEFFANGEPRKIDFTLSLVSYGGDAR